MKTVYCVYAGFDRDPGCLVYICENFVTAILKIKELSPDFELRERPIYILYTRILPNGRNEWARIEEWPFQEK